jgi:hypothetical protein
VEPDVRMPGGNGQRAIERTNHLAVATNNLDVPGGIPVRSTV